MPSRSPVVMSNEVCKMSPEHLDVLACPSCRGGISPSLQCKCCGRTFTLTGRVLHMLADAPKGGGWWGTDLPPIPILNLGKTGQPGYHQHRFGSTIGGWRKNRRERAVVDAFLRRLPRGAWVVDVPCGMGRFSDIACRRKLRFCGIDLNCDHVTYASEQITNVHALFIQGDISALPLRHGSMMAALCIRVSYYFDDDTLAHILTEVGRVAKEILLSYRDGGSVVGRWKLIRRRSSKNPWKNRTLCQITDIARRAGFRVCDESPRLIAVHGMQFARLRQGHDSQDPP